MTYRIALPTGGAARTLDLIEPNTSAIQRFLRREGLAGYEPSTVATLLSVFERAAPDFCFVDVGANIGLYSLLCAAVFDPRRVVALEPAPDLADLAEKIRDANGLTIDVRRIAASSANGTAELHLADATDVSNSLEPGFKSSARSVTVTTSTLDALTVGWSVPPSVLKIDVEGHESSVLTGARGLLEQHRPTMVIEVLNRRGGRLADAISKAVDGLEYHCYELAVDPTWESCDRVSSGDEHCDWLLTPEPIDSNFITSWESWHGRLARCTADQNSRVPIARTVAASFRRGGLSEVFSAAQRFLRR